MTLSSSKIEEVSQNSFVFKLAERQIDRQPQLQLQLQFLILGGFGAEPGQVQQGPREGSGEGLGGFGAEPGHVFNRVSKKVPEKVPGGFGAEPGEFQQGSEEGSGEGLGSFGAERGQVEQSSGEVWWRARSGDGSEKVWEALVQPGQVQQGSGEGSRRRFGRLWCRAKVKFNKFNRVPEKVPEKVPGSLGAKPSQFNGFCRRFRRRPGSFGAEPGQVQQGSGEGSRLTGFRRRRGEAKVPEKVWEVSVPSQVRFNRDPEKVPEKVWEVLVQNRVRFNRVPKKVPEKVWEALVQSQVRFKGFRRRLRRRSGEGFGNLWRRARSVGFPALGFAALFRKICKNKTLRLLGIPPKLVELDSIKNEASLGDFFKFSS